MKPLPEEFEIADPNERHADALLQRVRPLEASVLRRRRVWLAIERSANRRPRARTSGPVIAGILLCGATAASATMPRIWKRLQTPAAEVEMVSNARAPAALRRVPPPAPKVPVAAQEPTPAESMTLADPVAPRVEAPALVRRPVSARSRVPAAEPADPPASAALMVEAMRERRAGNLARARDLASEYRVKYPAGALQEEALALSIEAAAALGDDEARRLSMLYLQRYPRGRFRAQAQRVIDAAR